MDFPVTIIPESPWSPSHRSLLKTSRLSAQDILFPVRICTTCMHCILWQPSLLLHHSQLTLVLFQNILRRLILHLPFKINGYGLKLKIDLNVRTGTFFQICWYQCWCSFGMHQKNQRISTVSAWSGWWFNWWVGEPWSRSPMNTSRTHESLKSWNRPFSKNGRWGYTPYPQSYKRL